MPNRAKNKTFPVDRLRELIRYDPDTGKLYCAKTGREKFTSDNNGRYVGKVEGCQFYAHRVAWALYHGAWPGGEIDHINGDSLDNRLLNMRDVDRATNRRNAKLPKSNKTGTPGVCWAKNPGKWQAQIKYERRMIYLGQFDTLEEAVAVRKEAEKQYGFHPNHGRKMRA